jgi:pheromone shutdown protein TraB
MSDTGDGRVELVGTAHVSADSVDEVESAIRDSKPDVVAVELDEGRYRQMRGGAPEELEPGDLLEGNTVFQFLAYWMLSYVQSRLGEKFDIQPGADMLAAVETAEALGIDVELVDRDIQTTMQRFWKRMSILEKFRLIGGLAFGASDPRVAGITFGIFLGVILGPILALFGGNIGLTPFILGRVTGGVVLAAVLAYTIDRFGRSLVPDDDRRFLVAAGVALAAGLIGGVGLGVMDPLIARLGVRGFTVQAIGSMTIGLATGLAAGAVVGILLDATGLIEPADDDYEEFDMESLTDADVVTAMMEEFRQFSPGGAEALIDERDAFIAHKLVALRSAGHDVVAVVGAGHRAGIQTYLDDPTSLPPMASLTGRESGSRVPWGKIVAFGISAAFVAFFVLLALSTVDNADLVRLFGAWFAVNGLFAAGLAKAAGARWPSALVGGAVAWLTSVNPLLAPGWFAGYMELRHTPVNVGDISTLNDLLADETRPIRAVLSDMFDVPLFRLIMVVALTNVGSVVASLLFAAYVLPQFFADYNGVEGITRLMIQGAGNGADILANAVRGVFR